MEAGSHRACPNHQRGRIANRLAGDRNGHALTMHRRVHARLAETPADHAVMVAVNAALDLARAE